MNDQRGLADRDARLQEARDLRSGRRIVEALAALARLEALHPRFSRLFQERGHCHILLGHAPAAIEALQEALRLNPTLPSSWDMLEQLYRRSGQTVEADRAAQQLAALRQLPSEVVVANSLYADGDLSLAEEVIRRYLSVDQGNVGAARLLARIHFEGGATDAAQSVLQGVLDRAPDFHAARLDFAMVLLHQQKHAEARREAELLLKVDPANRDYLKQYCAACIGLGDYQTVIDLYGQLLASPDLSGAEVADLRLWRANALKTTGRLAEAISDYREALSARPDYGVAWFSLANLKTYRFTRDDVTRMRAAEAQPTLQEMDRIYLCFAIGKALEDSGDYAASWKAYEAGNALRRRTSRDRPEVADACALRLKSTFTEAFFAARQGWGCDDASPIFILGLPRSGSTLVEQILASHSDIEGTQELIEIDQYVAELCGRDPDCRLPLDPQALKRLTRTDARALGERFLVETRAYRRLGKPFFIDKMPNNFWHIGLIHLILPRSIIIDVRREPMACCFSNLKQLFGGENQEFSYGVEEVARRYRTYLDLMQHWRRVLPQRVLLVQYEDLVHDLDANVRRVLTHCNLPFEPACLSFHETERSVRTPSSEQVRQPLGREGLHQWRHYEGWLTSLRDALGDAVTNYRN